MKWSEDFIWNYSEIQGAMSFYKIGSILEHAISQFMTSDTLQ